MSGAGPGIRISIGAEVFSARLERALAPRSCACLEGLTPYRGKLIHARWSGEACWSPLASVWASRALLPTENATERPAPGQVLLFAGPQSEPEILITYGASRFACQAGPLAGNPVLTIEDHLSRLAELGREILWGGAMELRIDFSTERS